jgi:hypothetical protein
MMALIWPEQKVKDAAAVGIPHEATLRALGDDRCEVAPVAHEVRARLRPEYRVGVSRARLAPVVHSALLISNNRMDVIPGLVPGIQPSTSRGACGTADPGHKASE